MSSEETVVIEKRPHQLGPLDPDNLPDGYYVDNKGCIRDSVKQFLVAGGAALNIEGKPKGPHSTIIKQLKKRFKNGEVLIDELYKMITYDFGSDYYVNNAGEKKKTQFPRVKENDRLSAIKITMAYLYGRPFTNITIDKHVDIKIEAKMHQVAELVSKNREKLKVVSKDKELEIQSEDFEDFKVLEETFEEIIDAEFDDIITDCK